MDVFDVLMDVWRFILSKGDFLEICNQLPDVFVVLMDAGVKLKFILTEVTSTRSLTIS